ncbi:MAG TPA: TonB-dependent receptor [Gemmatimonadales bacterium]|nr:TonB-dependent receptor [Gemmatimonadales bacterium]
MRIRRAGITALFVAVSPEFLSSQGAPDTSGAPPRDTARAVPLTSETVITGDLLRALPIDDPRQALMLVPGVVLRSGDIGVAIAPQLAIRGSRLGAASVYVDGAPVRFQTFATQAMALATLGIDRISVTTGVPAAWVADAGGGIISYFTPPGGRGFAGTWRAETDEPFGDGSTVGYNRFEGTLSGPVPGMERATWLLAGATYGQRSQYYGRGAADQPAYVLGGLDTLVQWTDASGSYSVPLPRFIQSSGSCTAGDNYGFGCQGLRRPMDWSTVRRGLTKLAYSYGSGSSLTFTGLLLDVHQRAFPGADIADPALYRGGSGTSRLGVLNWGQGLGAFRGGPLTLSVNLSLASDQLIDGPLTPASELATRDPALGVEWKTLEFTGADSVAFPVSDDLLRRVRTNTGTRVPFQDRVDLRNAQQGRLNPYGLQSGWPTSGLQTSIARAWEHRLDGRAQLEWLPGTRHHVTLGGDAERTDASLYQSSLLNQIGFDAFRAKPSRFGVFASDRVALGPVVLDLGARYDHFTPGGDFQRTPGFTFSDPNWSPAAATDDTAYTNSVARVFARGRGKSLVSSRIRTAYAFSPNTSARAAYGQQVELPAFIDLLTNTNSDLSFTNTTDAFGRDVDYAKSELMELGARHAFGPHLSVDLSVYRKNNLAPYTFRFLPFASPRQASETLFINVLTKVDGGHGTGTDARLDWHAGTGLSASVSYSFLTTNTRGDTHALYALANVAVPNAWRAGTRLGSLARGLAAVVTIRVATGLPYTRLVDNGDGQVAPQFGPGLGGRAAEQLNASRLPTTKTLDLRLTKGVRIGCRALRAYADFRNLLNFTNVVALYAETGDVVNDLRKQKLLSPELAYLQAEASLAGALNPDGSINLSGDCNAWGMPPNCVALRRVEARFGNGDLLYTPLEQTRAFDTYYNSFFGPWRFHGPARTVRVGVEVGF